jgi:hypothetical protein
MLQGHAKLAAFTQSSATLINEILSVLIARSHADSLVKSSVQHALKTST